MTEQQIATKLGFPSRWWEHKHYRLAVLNEQLRRLSLRKPKHINQVHIMSTKNKTYNHMTLKDTMRVCKWYDENKARLNQMTDGEITHEAGEKIGLAPTPSQLVRIRQALGISKRLEQAIKRHGQSPDVEALTALVTEQATQIKDLQERVHKIESLV